MVKGKQHEGGNTIPKISMHDGKIPSRPALAHQNGSLYLNDLIDNLSDAFIATDIHFKITQWNKAAERIYGWGADEVMEHAIADFLNTEYETGNSDSAFQNIMADGIWSNKVFQTRKDGRKLQVFSTVSLVKNAAGDFIGLVAINRDITDQKLADERFRLAVESAPNAIVMVDQNGEIILINSQAEKYFGYQRAELIGASVDKLVPVRYAALHPRHRTGFLASPQKRNMGVGRDLYALRKDGSEFPVEIGLAPINTHDGAFVLATIVDITERIQAEEEMRRLNKELESFAHSISHDLRAPLRSVDGFSEMLVKKYADVLDGDGLHFLSRIQVNVHHMGQMIEDMLALAQMTRHELQFQTVNLSEIVRDILGELIVQEPGRSIQFEIEAQVEARCDAGLIRIVFQNLLGNSIKFTSKRADALIEFGRTSTKKFGRRVYFVRDNGVGFNMAYADKMFNAFQRLHTMAEFPGTGIGLATVQRIIHRHGGQIWAEAVPDQGATFYFVLGDLHDPS